MLDQIIKTALKQRLLFISIAILIIAYGLFILPKLPVDVFPDLNRPTVTIMTEAPGLAPEEVESLVTMPIEMALNGLPNVERIRSTSGVGLNVIYLEFAWGSDIFKNRQTVQEKLDQVKEKLPKGTMPVMGPIASIMGEIQLVGLSSKNNEFSPMQLRSMADWNIRQRLLSIPGVAQVISIGGGVRQFQILISATKMQQLQLSIDDVEHYLSDISKNTTGGYIEINKKEFLIRNIGVAKNKNDILKSVVGIHLGKPILVRDIAEVIEGPQNKRGDASVNGKPAVIISIQKQPGANTITLTRDIEIALSELRLHLPKDIDLNPNLFKQSNFIKNAIQNVKDALVDGVVLVLIILFLFLMNFRTTFITMTAIPLSFMLTALVFKFFDISINTMTLGGLAIAIGELVDDAIVDVENVYRRLKENSKKEHPENNLMVIFKASSEVRNSIIIATIIVYLVFIPLFSMGGIEGKLFAPLGISYVISLLASMVVSLTITPALCSYLLIDENKRNEVKDGVIVKFIKDWDLKILNFSIKRPLPIISMTVTFFLITLFLATKMGKDFLPKFNEGTATITVIAQPGISLTDSNRIGNEAEMAILKSPEVTSVSRRTGRAELDEHAEGVHYSELDVDFSEQGRNRTLVLEEIRKNLNKIDGVYINIGQPISHRLDHLLSGVKSQMALKIFGPDLSILRQKGSEINHLIEKIPGVVDLQVEQQVLVPQVKIQLLRDEAVKFGIVIGDLAGLLQKALQGDVVGQINENQKTIDVLMRFDDKSRSDLDLIKNTPIKIIPDGSVVKLYQVADLYESTGPNIINRENSMRRIVVQANSSGRDLNGLVSEIQKSIEKNIVLPEGYFISYGGQFESQKKANQQMMVLSLLAVAGIFLVLYMHFQSIFIAIQIMLNIPMAFIGGIIGIFITGKIISVASLVAFVTLSGISSRNGIMMISHYLHLMKNEGESFTKEMVIRGSLERLVPVLMTALTAILGLLPLVLTGDVAGKEILYPVAVVIIGGLISSTLLDLFVTPTIFYNYGKSSALISISKSQNDVFTGEKKC